LTRIVQFYLHDSFPNDQPRITVQNNKTKLYTEGYGAFTVGAVMDNGDTALEYDLSKDKRFPQGFRDN